MKSTFLAALAAVALSAAPATAAIIDVTYTASVSIADGTNVPGLTAGQVLNGEFIFNSDTGAIVSSTLGAFSVTGGNTTVGITPAQDSATYQFGTQSVLPGQSNDNITVDLEALTNFVTNDPSVLLQDPTLASQLDLNGPADSPFSSTAVFRNTDASGNGQVVFAYLDSVSVSVFEPASAMMLMTGLGGLVAARRRRV